MTKHDEKETTLALELRRVILFTRDVDRLAAWYRDVLGLRVVESDKGFVDLDAGGVRLALHSVHKKHEAAHDAARPHKLAFFAADVDAARAVLEARGADLDDVRRFGALALCDGRDPDGNVFQLSNRP